MKFLIGLLFFCTPSMLVSAAINPEVRDNFSLLVDQMCQASLVFDLEETVLDTSLRYHEHINCLFNDALLNYKKETYKEFSKYFQKIKKTSPLEMPSASLGSECRSVKSTWGRQRQKGMRPLCTGTGHEGGIYSSCQLTQLVYNEWCGYQEYLSWKYVDDSLVRESGALKSRDLDAYKTSQQALIRKELGGINAENKRVGSVALREEGLAQKALNQMLLEYRGFEQNYRDHAWYMLLQALLEKTKVRLEAVEEALSIFPKKAHDQASKNPDQ